MYRERTGTCEPFDNKVDHCNDQYSRYEFFYTHCLMYVVRKEVCNNGLIERMMTSRKVEVEVSCDNTAKPLLHIPHPTLSAICLAICRALRISSIGGPNHHFNHLKAENNARNKVGLSLQRFYLRQSTMTKSHLLSLLTAHSSSRSHDSHHSSPIRREGLLVPPSRNVRPENSADSHHYRSLFNTSPGEFRSTTSHISLKEITFHQTARGSQISG
jgi:hypothetical protein